MSSDVVGASVQGQPAVHVSLLVVLVLLAFARSAAESLVTVAHEGGHMVVVVLTGRGPFVFNVNEDTATSRGGGATRFRDGSWGVGLIFVGLAGYLTPPLLGLAATALVLDGKSFSVLLASLVLLFVAFLKAADLFTIVILLLATAGIGWVLFQGGPALQAGVAVGLTWLLLIGGITTLFGQGFGSTGSDASQLEANTWMPAIVWVALFWFVAIISLWVGGRRLLGL